LKKGAVSLQAAAIFGHSHQKKVLGKNLQALSHKISASDFIQNPKP